MPWGFAAVAVGSVVSGALGASASKKAGETEAQAATDAAQTQLQGTREAIAAQKEFFYQSRNDTAAWRSVGQSALQEIADLYGIGAISVPGGGATPVATTAYPGAPAGGAPGAAGALQSTMGTTAPTGGTPDWQAYSQTGTGQAAWQEALYSNTPFAQAERAKGGATPEMVAQDWYTKYASSNPDAAPLTYTGANDAAPAPGSPGYADGLQAPQIANGSSTTADTRTAAQRQTDAQGRLQSQMVFNRGDLANSLTTGAGFTESPDYQFRLSQGLDALDRSAAARGKLISGDQMRAISDYGQGSASQEYGNWWNRTSSNYNAANDEYNKYIDRLTGLAGVGGQAASNDASQAVQTGANIASLTTQGANATATGQMNAGQARASGYLNSANAWGSALGGLASAGGMYAGMQGLGAGGSGGSGSGRASGSLYTNNGLPGGSMYGF